MNEPQRPDGIDRERENINFVVGLGLQLLRDGVEKEEAAGGPQMPGMPEIRNNAGNMQAGSLLQK